MTILTPLIGVLVFLLRPSILEGKRLNGAQFAASVVISFVLWCGAWSWFCEQWAAVAIPRWGDWLPPFLVELFYPWELVIAPFLDGAIAYSAIFFYLKLLNSPAGFTEPEVLEWRCAMRTKYLQRIGALLVLYFMYLGTSRWIVWALEKSIT